jgi:hypothetical protein
MADDFFRSLDVLHVPSSFFYKKVRFFSDVFFQFLVIKTLDLDPDLELSSDPDPD